MDYLRAFLVGGAICVVGQLLMDLTSYRITPAHILVGFVSGGAILSAFNLYQPLINFAGAGATVPLPGFGHALAQGAIKGAQENGLLGAFGGGVEATAVGVAATVVFGYMVADFFTPKGD
ncbi:MAG TPA: stage V sporulation protein AE [Bacillota bacterium]|nr:stage V sporulation protein AE [Bacillota bacterium]